MSRRHVIRSALRVRVGRREGASALGASSPHGEKRAGAIALRHAPEPGRARAGARRVRLLPHPYPHREEEPSTSPPAAFIRTAAPQHLQNPPRLLPRPAPPVPSVSSRLLGWCARAHAAPTLPRALLVSNPSPHRLFLSPPPPLSLVPSTSLSPFLVGSVGERNSAKVQRAARLLTFPIAAHGRHLSPSYQQVCFATLRAGTEGKPNCDPERLSCFLLDTAEKNKTNVRNH